MWLDEEEDNKGFDNANFYVYAGIFEGNNFKRGIFLQKKEDNYYVYHDDFTLDEKRNDDHAFFYSYSLDRLFHGKIENDIFKSWYIVYFVFDSGDIEKIVYCDFDSNKDVKKITRRY